MSDAVYAFDVDDCLECGGQVRLPSSFGPVTIQSIRQEAAPPDGDICGIVGNWVNLPSLIPDWREFLRFLLPPVPSSSHKAFWLAWLKAQYPGYQHYVMVGNDPSSHDRRPAYWNQQWPGTLPVTHVPGDRLLSNDIGAASEAGWEFIREDDWAAGRRIGTIPPPPPGRPIIQFPKHTRPPMIEKVFTIPGAVKSVNYDSGQIEAIVSVTGNLDLQKDVIMPGAYRKALESGRLPKVVKQHDWKTWLGKTTDAEELRPGSPHLPAKLLSAGFGGVYVKGEFTMEDPVAAAVHAHLKRGVIDEFSVGFDVDQDGEGKSAEEVDDQGVRHIKSIFPWYEWSPVLMGANPATLPLAVKQAVPGEQEAVEGPRQPEQRRSRRRSNDALYVPETRLIVAVGASVAAAYRARH